MANRQRRLDLLASAVLVVSAAVSLAVVPRAAWAQTQVPSVQAIYGLMVTLVALAVLRAQNRPRAERVWLAVLLAAMPLVYVRSVPPGGALWPQLAGFAFYALVAALGYFRFGWLLAAGIAAHGLWDLAHLGRGPVPDWYVIACAVIDGGLGVYAASRLRAWREAARPSGNDGARARVRRL